MTIDISDDMSLIGYLNENPPKAYKLVQDFLAKVGDWTGISSIVEWFNTWLSDLLARIRFWYLYRLSPVVGPIMATVFWHVRHLGQSRAKVALSNNQVKDTAVSEKRSEAVTLTHDSHQREVQVMIAQDELITALKEDNAAKDEEIAALKKLLDDES